MTEHTQTNPIVTLNDAGAPVTTSLTIAEGVGNPHKSVIQLIRQNISDIEEFGPIAFEMRKGEALPQGGFARATEYAILNEQHATLLITYMRNNEVVRAFKKRLVKAFFEMRNALNATSHPETLLPSEQQTLSEIVHARVVAVPAERKGKALAEIWSRLHRKFRIAKYSQLPRTQLADAIMYVTAMQIRSAPDAADAQQIPQDYERISEHQREELAEAVKRALFGWLFDDSLRETQHIHNRLRVEFNVKSVNDLPAADFDRALSILKEIRGDCATLLTLVSELKSWFLKERIGAGAPWTPQVLTQWKKQIREQLPSRPNWLAMQKRLTH